MGGFGNALAGVYLALVWLTFFLAVAVGDKSEAFGGPFILFLICISLSTPAAILYGLDNWCRTVAQCATTPSRSANIVSAWPPRQGFDRL